MIRKERTMIIVVNNKISGKDLINEEISRGGIKNIRREIRDLRRDFKNAHKGRIQLKDIDQKWRGLTRLERIKKGKRFKEYIKQGYITGVTIIKDVKNQPIEYYIH